MPKRFFITVLSAFAFAFAFVLFWRGTWLLADIFLFPKNQVLSALISLLAGLIILWFSGLWKKLV